MPVCTPHSLLSFDRDCHCVALMTSCELASITFPRKLGAFCASSNRSSRRYTENTESPRPLAVNQKWKCSSLLTPVGCCIINMRLIYQPGHSVTKSNPFPSIHHHRISTPVVLCEYTMLNLDDLAPYLVQHVPLILLVLSFETGAGFSPFAVGRVRPRRYHPKNRDACVSSNRIHCWQLHVFVLLDTALSASILDSADGSIESVLADDLL
jgi:hypothetical protein